MKEIIKVELSENTFSIAIDGSNQDLLTGIAHILMLMEQESETLIDESIDYIKKYIETDKRQETKKGVCVKCNETKQVHDFGNGKTWCEKCIRKNAKWPEAKTIKVPDLDIRGGIR